jgi:Ca2+-binding RTX toxin-like protein
MNLLPDILNQVYQQLSLFANGNNFGQVFNTSFGSTYNITASEILRSQWKTGNFSQLPQIKVISSSILRGANGAYASSNNTIYLSDKFLATASVASLKSALLQEIGHYVDAQINKVDSAGDEGAIFSELVQGYSLNAQTLNALKAKNDHATITVNGQVIQVEEQNFTGTSGDDSIIGTSTNDTINSGLGYDTVDGGAGTDLLIVDYSSKKSFSSSLTSNGTGGFNGYFDASYSYTTRVNFSNIEQFQITGTGVADTIYTGDGNDIINSGGGNDIISTGAGNDTINGGAGNDAIYAGSGSDIVNGGTGIDTLVNDLSSSISNLTWDTTGTTVISPTGGSYTNIEAYNITTGSGNDTIKLKGGYNDSINTGVGNDTINAGLGNDTVNGEVGTDLLILDYSSNSYSGISTSLTTNSAGGLNGYFYAYNNFGGTDRVDFISIEQFNITGTGVGDTIYTGDGNDIINSGGGNDTIYASLGNDTVNGGDGIDTLYDDFSTSTSNLTFDTTGTTAVIPTGSSYTNIEAFGITTGSGNDTIKLKGSYNDTINTGAGNDTINTGLGRDNVNGEVGTDLLILDYSSNSNGGIQSSITTNSAGGFNGSFYANNNFGGTYGTDRVDFTSIEQFNITGTGIADTIYTASGNDTINSGAGNDTIYAGLGNDTVNGGDGIDTLFDDFSTSTSNLTFDTTGTTAVIPTGSSYTNIESFGITTGSGNDTIKLKGSYGDNINTGAGNDTINSGLGRDAVNGEVGTDLLILDYSSNSYGGIQSSITTNSAGGFNGSFSASNNFGGTDSVNFTSIEQFNITGTGIADTIYTASGNDTINSGAGNDTIYAGLGNDTVNGGDGIDTLFDDFSTSTSNLTFDTTGTTAVIPTGSSYTNIESFGITTGSGNDTIKLKGSYGDNINTGAGNDTINSGLGRDAVNGEVGTDLLILDYSSNSYGGIQSSITTNSAGGFNGSFSASNNFGGTDSVNFTSIEQFNITGTGIADTIYTASGNDIINGGVGNDTINAGAGNDTIDGTDGANFNGEIDILSGGTGNDLFILGTATNAYYDDGNVLTNGSDDYANIIDFNSGDIIQLQGTSSNYLLTVVGADTQILIDKPGTEPDELIGIVRNQTSLSLTATSFNYIASVTLPTITLAVSPNSVVEDGATNLVYTFTRSGATTNALTVNYTVGSSATFNIDYTQIGAASFTETTGSITFAAGSSTAILTIDPTADTNIESDETIALTLTSGTSYTIGTNYAIAGTITNDDTNPGNIITGTDANETFTATIQQDIINAQGGNDSITSTFANLQQNDSVTGGLGTDTLIITGGTVNDTIAFDFSSNQFDLSGITAAIADIENFDFSTFVGTVNFFGTTDDNTIKSGSGNDDLSGGDGNDTLDGGTGADNLIGGNGNDTYIVDNANDMIVEYFNQGIDTVQSALTYTLKTNVENLTLTGTTAINGTGNTLNNTITGNSANNILTGLAGNDILNGGLGADTLIGGVGNDTYYVDNVADVVTENLNEGTDIVNSSVTYTLSNNIETLILTGTTAIDGTGNTLDNTITGNGANNTLIGAAGIDTLTGNAGNDILVGGLGNDLLTGGIGADIFRFNAPNEGLDNIQDFKVAELDIIQVSAAGFAGGLVVGTLAATQFISGAGITAPNSSSQRFIYNTTNGALFYDADGNGAVSSAVQIATLTGLPAIAANHIAIIA